MRKSAVSIESPDFMRLKQVPVLDCTGPQSKVVRWWEVPDDGPKHATPVPPRVHTNSASVQTESTESSFKKVSEEISMNLNKIANENNE